MATFFEVGEVIFDGVEIGAVGRKEKDEMPLFCGDGFEVFFSVKRGMVPDQSGTGPPLFTEHSACPGVDPLRMGGALEQEGG